MRRSILFPFLFLLAGCADSEIVGIHIALAKDGAGTMTTRSLVPSTAIGPAEARSQGVAWDARANLYCSQGRFTSLAEVKLGDNEVRFTVAMDEEMPRVRVYFRRGPEVKWIDGLVPAAEERKRMAAIYDPSGKTKIVGDTVRIDLQLPGQVITSGVIPSGRGVEADHERGRAFLVLPVRTVQEKGDEIVWDVSWK